MGRRAYSRFWQTRLGKGRPRWALVRVRQLISVSALQRESLGLASAAVFAAWVGNGRVRRARASRLLKSPAWRTWLRVVGIAIPLLLLLCLRRSRGCASCHGARRIIGQLVFNYPALLRSSVIRTAITSFVPISPGYLLSQLTLLNLPLKVAGICTTLPSL